MAEICSFISDYYNDKNNVDLTIYYVNKAIKSIIKLLNSNFSNLPDNYKQVLWDNTYKKYFYKYYFHLIDISLKDYMLNNLLKVKKIEQIEKLDEFQNFRISEQT